LEGWLDKIIDNAGKNGAKITVTAGIQPIKSLEYESAPDPHAWMDLSLGKKYVKNMRDALIDLMPEYADTIQMKYLSYIEKINTIDKFIRGQMKEIPDKNRVLITSHDAFQYFGRAYGLELHSLQGLSTDTDIKTGDILNITQLLSSRSIPAIFVESTINPKVINQIARDYDVKIGGELYADALSSEDGPANTYLNMLKHNASVISKALQMKDSKDNSESQSYARWISYGLIFSIMLGLFISAYYKLS
jgi:ABC-type Zn uptake system ZnuABC Zn-binding protein ZnuA